MNNIVSDWDHMAQAYETFNNSEDTYSYNIEWPCIRNMLPELQGKTVLDLGCGTGIFSFSSGAICPCPGRWHRCVPGDAENCRDESEADTIQSQLSSGGCGQRVYLCSGAF